MPPTKKLPAPKESKSEEPTAGAALVLFAKNLEEIRRWYRGSKDSGQSFGHVVITELLLTHVSTALELAMKGQAWEKPTASP